MIAKSIAITNLIIGGVFVILGLLPLVTTYPESATTESGYWSFILAFSHIFQFILLGTGSILILLGTYIIRLKNEEKEIDRENYNPKYKVRRKIDES